MQMTTPIRRVCLFVVIAAAMLASQAARAQSEKQAAAPARATGAYRPPAVPLVTHDPYFSAWLMGDKLADDWSKHWTGATHAMTGLARIDGKPYRFMGGYRDVPAMEQKSLGVTPTRSTFTFEAGGVQLAV